MMLKAMDESAPNVFETALLERVATGNPNLNLHLADLHFLGRKFTGVGSFTDFVIQGQSKSRPRQVISLPFAVAIPALQRGLLVVVFLEGDKLLLKTATFDEPWDGSFEGFSFDAIAG